MKLNEITQPNFITKYNEVRAFLDLYNIPARNYTVAPDGTVDTKFMATISERSAKNKQKITRLPVKFGKAGGTFFLDNNNLTTLEGCPRSVNGAFQISWNKSLTSFDHMPEFIRDAFFFSETKITSLVGIHEKLKGMGPKGEVHFSFTDIKEGGIGLLLIPGLKVITNSLAQGTPKNNPFKIIRKYIGRPDDIYDCQAELIDNGFGEYAKL